jgi:hypothetical protein
MNRPKVGLKCSLPREDENRELFGRKLKNCG